MSDFESFPIMMNLSRLKAKGFLLCKIFLRKLLTYEGKTIGAKSSILNRAIIPVHRSCVVKTESLRFRD